MAGERALLQAGFRYALSLTAERAEAEDLVQEAWCRLHRRHGRVTEKAMLFTAVRNIFLDQYRRGRLVVFEAIDEAEAPAEADEAMEARLIARDLEAPLAALRPDEREALFLTVVAGYTAEETARMTARARGTVLSLIHRAKAKLRRALDDDRDSPPGAAGTREGSA